MNLDQYLNSEGALTLPELRNRIGVKSDAQLRQWRDRWNGRQPSPQYAMSIESATEGRVKRWDVRPADWHLIWPDLIGTEGAPDIPEAKAA